MATCSVQTLLQNPCLCEVTVSPAKMAKLALLCKIYNAVTMASCDVPTLMSRAKCFCQVTTKPVDMLELQLLCEISAAFDSGGASQIVYYTGANPNSDGVRPANTQKAAIAVKPGGTTYVWSVSAQNWQ
jgi:hypothetical protein